MKHRTWIARGALVCLVGGSLGCTFQHSTHPQSASRAARADGLEMELREIRATPARPDTELTVRVRNRSQTPVDVAPNEATLVLDEARVDALPQPEGLVDIHSGVFLTHDPVFGCLGFLICLPTAALANAAYRRDQAAKRHLRPGEAETFRIQFAERPESLEEHDTRLEWHALSLPVTDRTAPHAGLSPPRPPTAVLAVRMGAGLDIGGPEGAGPAANIEAVFGTQGPRLGWTGSLLLGTSMGLAADLRIPVWPERGSRAATASIGYAGVYLPFEEKLGHGPRLTVEYLWSLPHRRPLFGYRVRESRLGVYLSAQPVFTGDGTTWMLTLGGAGGLF